MTTLQILEIIGIIVGSLAAIAVGLGYAYGKFKEGRTKQSIEGIEADKKQEELLTGRINTLQALVETKDRESQIKINELTKEVGVLTGRLLEKDQKLKEYTEIFQGRNPQMEKFIEQMTAAVATMGEGQKDIHKFMMKIDGALMSLTSKKSSKRKLKTA